MAVYYETSPQWRKRSYFGEFLSPESGMSDLEKGAYMEELELLDCYNRESDNDDYKLALTILPEKRNK